MSRPLPSRARLPDWPERLATLIEDRRHAPFIWGGHDCCLFVGDAALAVADFDPAAQFRGAYASEAEAEAVLGSGGLEPFVADLFAGLDMPECPPPFAQRGDVALVLLGNQPMLGVVVDNAVAAPGIEGLVFVPLRRATRAWAV